MSTAQAEVGEKRQREEPAEEVDAAAETNDDGGKLNKIFSGARYRSALAS